MDSDDSKKRIILIEDEDFIRDLYKRQLDLAGFTTDAFPNGTTGLEALKKNQYDLLLLDVMLPDINGLEILRRIKADQATSGMAVVLLTNLGQESIIKESFALGSVGYLIKASYTPDQIVQEVKNFIEGKPSNIAQA